jgi:hypothetical protein
MEKLRIFESSVMPCVLAGFEGRSSCVMQGETTIFYENEYQRATNRLGWISAPARKFLIGRHALRSIGCLENEWRSGIREFD